jgi:hypothetical protein
MDWITRSAGTMQAAAAPGHRILPRQPRTATMQKEQPMKLSTSRVRQTLDQLDEQPAFHDTQAIPDDHPVVPKLNQLFGEHTFFVDSEGLHIVEPAVGDGASDRSGQVVKLASWSDARHTTLEPHPPQPTDVVIALRPDEET